MQWQTSGFSQLQYAQTRLQNVPKYSFCMQMYVLYSLSMYHKSSSLNPSLPPSLPPSPSFQPSPP